MKKTVKKIDTKNVSNEWEYAGEVGVDSGQVMICDPCYLPGIFKEGSYKISGKNYKDDSEWTPHDHRDLFNPKNKGKFNYSGCCVTTKEKGYGQLNYKMGHAGAGVVAQSGYGDGCYKVYVKKNDEGRVIEMKIKFD